MGFIESDNVGDIDDRRSTCGHLFMLGNRAVSWASKKQPVVALSTTEAEYIAAALCPCQGIWLRRALDKQGNEDEEGTVIMYDNNSTIQLSKNLVFHGKWKHIDVRFYFLRDLVNNGFVELKYCNTQG